MESQLEKRHLWSGKCTICVLDYGGGQQNQRSPEEREGAPHTTQPETRPDQVIKLHIKKCIMLYNIRILLMYGLY